MSKKIIEKYLQKQLEAFEEHWKKEKEQEIITLHNAIAQIIEEQKPHPSTLITVLRIIEHETIKDALTKIEQGTPPEQILKQKV